MAEEDDGISWRWGEGNRIVDTSHVTVEGMMMPDGSLEIPGRFSLRPGRVRVTVEVLPDPPTGRPSLAAFFDSVRKRHESGEIVGRSREEIDASVAALREEAEGRIEAINQLRDSFRRAGEGPGC